MKYLLDTHAVVWLFEGSPKLGKVARKLIADQPAEGLAISDIALLELAMLSARGKIALQPDSVSALTDIAAKLNVLAISPQIAICATSLPLPHGDPFDRVIAATAQIFGLTLITKDCKLREAAIVPTVW